MVRAVQLLLSVRSRQLDTANGLNVFGGATRAVARCRVPHVFPSLFLSLSLMFSCALDADFTAFPAMSGAAPTRGTLVAFRTLFA